MPAFLEMDTDDGPVVAPLGGDRFTLGKSPESDLPFGNDTSVSRLHAILVRYNAGWCVRDLSSRNGTFVNGDQVNGEKPLRDGDRIRIGRTTIVFRSSDQVDVSSTTPAEPAPRLTPRERDILRELCRPILVESSLSGPASTGVISRRLYVSEAAIRQYLLRLSRKFGVADAEPGQRRLALAAEAIRRGAVSRADLRSTDDG